MFVLDLRASGYIIEFSTDNIEIFLIQWYPVSGRALFVFNDAQATAVCLSDSGSVWWKAVTVQWWNDANRVEENFHFVTLITYIHAHKNK